MTGRAGSASGIRRASRSLAEPVAVRMFLVGIVEYCGRAPEDWEEWVARCTAPG